MRRILTVALLIGMLCLSLAGVSSAAVYNEAPMLRVQVAAGELPPVEERLPEEPLVLPVEEIGQYGGTLRTLGVGRQTFAAYLRIESLINMSNDSATTLPGVAKDWKLSEDGKTFTLQLRKGMKWSDGEPFTADDILFWWEDIVLNDEYMPVKPPVWMQKGELMKVEKEGDYTIHLRFAYPYPGIAFLLRIPDTTGRQFDGGTSEGVFAPKHYLKKWHPKYNPQAAELAKEEGFATWVEAFAFHSSWFFTQQDIDLPVVGMFKLESVTATEEKWVRNPYYFKVDPAGNQLPYIDRNFNLIFTSAETTDIMMLAGDVDFNMVGVADIPLFRENQEKGGYHIEVEASAEASAWSAFCFNLNHPDPVLREIFQDIRWGHAMSLALDREEINEVLFFGEGTPRQYTVHPSASFYEERWGEAYAEYDPDEANRLLDEMGLDKRDSDGFRLRPDGETLAIMIEGYVSAMPMLPLIKEYWDDVGVKTDFKEDDIGLFITRLVNSELDVVPWVGDRMTEGMWYALRLSLWDNFFYARSWNDWLQSGGENGEEPPEEIKHMFEVANNWRVTNPGSEEYMRLAKEQLDFFSEHLYVIGTVGMPPVAVYIKNNLKNYSVGMLTADSGTLVSKFPAQWYLEQE